MKFIKVRASAGQEVRTPEGIIGPDKYLEVPSNLFIRRRLADGDLEQKPKTRKTKGSKGRKK